MTKLREDDRTGWTGETLALARTRMEERLAAAGLREYAFLRPGEDLLSPEVQRILVVLFPYLADQYDERANLSLYCRGRDYHALVPRYLDPVGEAAKEVLGDGFSYHAYADTGPYRDRELALQAGLGFIGRSQMLINERYGTYFFIAYLVLSAPVPADKVWERLDPGVLEVQCKECGRCSKVCPGKVLPPEGNYDWSRCRSAITQKKGELSEEELRIFYKDRLIFGCDLCQTVCPYNQQAQPSSIPEFTEDRIDFLTLEDLEGLSRKAFLQKYPERAFTWRGPEVLRRNLRLFAEKASVEEGQENHGSST